MLAFNREDLEERTDDDMNDRICYRYRMIGMLLIASLLALTVLPS